MNTQQNDGGHAFPTGMAETDGLSKRDWFAGMALQGLATRDGYDMAKEIALDAYGIADAMLAVRERKAEAL